MDSLRRVLVISEPDGLWRARELGEGLATRGHEVRYAQPGAGERPWKAEPAPEAVVCVGWGTLAALGRAPCPVVLDLPGPCLAGEPPGPELRRRAQAKLAALRLADYFTCAGLRQRLYFRSWLTLAEIPQADRRLAVVAAGQETVAVGVPGYLAPDVTLDPGAAVVAPLAEFLRSAQVHPAPPVTPGSPAPERLKGPKELLAEVRYHYRHGGLRAVWGNSVGFAGKLLRRALHTR